jgi:hypothetical protein
MIVYQCDGGSVHLGHPVKDLRFVPAAAFVEREVGDGGGEQVGDRADVDGAERCASDRRLQFIAAVVANPTSGVPRQFGKRTLGRGHDVPSWVDGRWGRRASQRRPSSAVAGSISEAARRVQ